MHTQCGYSAVSTQRLQRVTLSVSAGQSGGVQRRGVSSVTSLRQTCMAGSSKYVADCQARRASLCALFSQYEAAGLPCVGPYPVALECAFG